MIIQSKGYARIGLIGNPSDGYNGKTISCAINNFWADVTLWESPSLQIQLNPICDPNDFESLNQLYHKTSENGYYGGLRLIQASCKKFYEYCQKEQIQLPSKNFTITYNTNIPRQIGLGGSSAIITAMMKALMQFYNLSYDQIDQQILPSLILSVETEELKINAGLQDRVIQVYGGTVFMDFSTEIITKSGTYDFGKYEYIDSTLIPSLFLVYLSTPSDSGKIHSDVNFRYQQNDSEVVLAMQTFADYAASCRTALENHDINQVKQLMNKNFDLRRQIFGDTVIGQQNLEMIEIARNHGCPAKFAGSSGAVIGIYEDWAQLQQLGQAYKQQNYKLVKLSIDCGNQSRYLK